MRNNVKDMISKYLSQDNEMRIFSESDEIKADDFCDYCCWECGCNECCCCRCCNYSRHSLE